MKFEELVREMKSEYFNTCGEDPAGDAKANGVIEALAAEVYALLCKEGHTLGDAFLQTAESEYLDRHAAMRGIERKKSTAATGELVFYAKAAQEFAVEVPQGTIPYSEVKDEDKERQGKIEGVFEESGEEEKPPCKIFDWKENRSVEYLDLPKEREKAKNQPDLPLQLQFE